MLRRNAYYTLMASLPALPAQLDGPRRLITRPALEHRLQMLDADDAGVLAQLIDFLAWDRQPLGRTDEEVIVRYRALVATTRHPLVRMIIIDRMDMRTLVSALRRRHMELGPPVGVGQWVDPIRRRWSEPGFGLLARFPWLANLDRLIVSGQADEAERLMLNVTWNAWRHSAHRHYFDLEAVLFYVARWALLNRWASRDASAGRARLETIIKQLVDGHVHINN